MKNFIVAVFLFLSFSTTVYSQDARQTTDIVESEIAENRVQPRFPGEKGDFQKYIAYKIKSAINKPMNIKVSFVVEIDGSLSSVKFLTYVREPLRGKLSDAILSSPTWMPGSINGVPARVEYTLPIIIKF